MKNLLTNTIFIYLLRSVICVNNIYGDSILEKNTPIQKNIETSLNTSFENYATIGAGIRSGWVISIPEQYTKHHEPYPKNVIMNGGGNDVFTIRWDCVKFNDKCRENINYIAQVMGVLIKLMRKDGVENIIYIGFYYNSNLNQAIDYGTERFKKQCEIQNKCYFIDLRDLEIPINWDGIHPTTKGYKIISDSILETIHNYNITF